MGISIIISWGEIDGWFNHLKMMYFSGDIMRISRFNDDLVKYVVMVKFWSPDQKDFPSSWDPCLSAAPTIQLFILSREWRPRNPEMALKNSVENHGKKPWIPMDSPGFPWHIISSWGTNHPISGSHGQKRYKIGEVHLPEMASLSRNIWRLQIHMKYIYIYYYIYENIWKSSIWIIMNIDES